ncbi:C6 zinc finger domain protein [Aspergillus campestris IBT 28561]|uniref:C6 zinc finger domain protein n=1 Tax=Aspergillus campestris (strain IBT 28561) TaxID=1392248 RepID=A0A2I1CUD1_ASPC2|nr:C6 zinc finger domain protein [Aspergillus campestris IBT 28561]PKY01217.1 C6 zinc finger domain protein [Aspergillus campestris IBT 28561]
MGEEQRSQQKQAHNNPRACQPCRASKVKCDQPDPSMPCLRCQRSGKPCIDAASQPGNRRRQFNDRILEIESRIESILSSAELRDSAGDNPPATSPLHSLSESSRNNRQHDWNPPMGAGIPFNGGSSGIEDLKSTIQSWLNANITDLDDRTTETIFSRYLTNMASKFPVVVFPPSTTAADVRSDNPILFLAILDVASSGFCALETQRNLRKLIVQLYVHCMLRSEQYTLGLLQALIVSAMWYRTIEPVMPGEQMDIYQISHTAANMALIMRLGERLNINISSREKEKRPGSVFREESLPARRVWLGCHYICSNTSMSLRAPNVMRWTRLMDECLGVLETSPAALPSDRLFCQHIRLQHITEEFAMHLSAGGTSSVDESRAIYIHRAFKRQLDEWLGSIADGWDAHCTATGDVDIPSEDSPPIVTIEPHAITEFTQTIDNIFRVFTSLDMSTIRALPAMYLIRIIYTFLILVKLHFAAAKLPTQDAAVLQIDRLQVSERLDRVIQMTAGWGPLWPATKLTTVLVRMREWLESGEEAGSWLTGWEIKTHFNMVEAASDDATMVDSSSQGPASWVPLSLASTDVNTDTVRFSLEPPLGTDLQSMSQATESCFPGKEAPDFMQMQDEGVPPAVCQRLGDLPEIDQMEMGMGWSQFPNMGFDLSNLDVPFSTIPLLPVFDLNAATKEDFPDRDK